MVHTNLKVPHVADNSADDVEEVPRGTQGARVQRNPRRPRRFCLRWETHLAVDHVHDSTEQGEPPVTGDGPKRRVWAAEVLHRQAHPLEVQVLVVFKVVR